MTGPFPLALVAVMGAVLLSLLVRWRSGPRRKLRRLQEDVWRMQFARGMTSRPFHEWIAPEVESRKAKVENKDGRFAGPRPFYAPRRGL
jgi:hypothetical protein